MTTAFNPKAYSLPVDSTVYMEYNPDPFMNGEVVILAANQDIPSDVKGSNGAKQRFAGFVFMMNIELPHMIRNKTEQCFMARLLSPHRVLIQTTVRSCAYVDIHTLIISSF